MSDNGTNVTTAEFAQRGRIAIACIAGGIVIGILGLIGLRIRPVGLGVGTFALVSGLGILLRRRKTQFRAGLIVTVAGFLMLLANPRFGLVAGFAGYFLITGAVGLVVFGIAKAIKLSWDLIRRS
jgi:hypothetical protein